MTSSSPSRSPSLSIIVPSCGRRTLGKTLESIWVQMEAGDQLLVDVNADGDWGHSARNRQMQCALGDYLMFIDDDDVYMPGALATVRHYVSLDPGRMHMFRMVYPSQAILWLYQGIEIGNVSTQMVVVPRSPVGVWGDRYQGDYDFAKSTAELIGEPIWHPEIICQIG